MVGELALPIDEGGSSLQEWMLAGCLNRRHVLLAAFGEGVNDLAQEAVDLLDHKGCLARGLWSLDRLGPVEVVGGLDLGLVAASGASGEPVGIVARLALLAIGAPDLPLDDSRLVSDLQYEVDNVRLV